MKIGIDLGGSHIGLGVINSKNEIIEAYEKDFTEENKKDIISVIENFIVEKVTNLEDNYEIECIGIAVPGVAKNGVIIKTVNLDINNYNIAKSLQEKLNCFDSNSYSKEDLINGNENSKKYQEYKITVRNDAKCACLAEFNNMVKEDKNLKNANVVFLTIGTGIGGGVIYNGNLLEGHKFEGYEFGHIIIKENGIKCKCGNFGCFERYGSILEYKNRVKKRLKIPLEINSDPLREIMKARRDEIRDIDEQYISDLAIGIANLINIFEPDIVVIGGGFTHFSYMFEDRLKSAIINSNLLFNKRDDLDLRMAELGNNAGIIGATIC